MADEIVKKEAQLENEDVDVDTGDSQADISKFVQALGSLSVSQRKDIMRALQGLDGGGPDTDTIKPPAPELKESVGGGIVSGQSKPPSPKLNTSLGRGLVSARGLYKGQGGVRLPPVGPRPSASNGTFHPNGMSTPRGTSHPARGLRFSPPPNRSPPAQRQVFFQSPRLPSFSGDVKSEVSYRIWRAEVRGLQSDVHLAPAALLQLIRRSLKGMAAECLVQLGDLVSVDEVIAYFDEIFGEVLTPEQILGKFYVSSQEARESVAAWGCRLREILSRCPDPFYYEGEQAEAMIRQKFWSGMRNEKVKTAIRHLVDRGASFSELMIAARRVEQEDGVNVTKPANVSTLVTDTPLERMDKVDQILKKLGEMESRMKELEKSQAREAAKRKDAEKTRNLGTDERKGDAIERSGGKTVKCWGCHQVGHVRRNCPKSNPSKSGNP